MCTLFSAVWVGTSARTSNEPIQEIIAIVTSSWSGAKEALQELKMQAGVSHHPESVLIRFHSYSQPD